MRLVRLVLWLLAVFFVWVVTVAASGGSQSTAIAIAGVVGALLPLGLKLIHADGHLMVVITVVASFVVTVVAELVSGEIVFSDLQHTDPGTLFALFMGVYALSQLVYATLTQSPKTASAVT